MWAVAALPRHVYACRLELRYYIAPQEEALWREEGRTPALRGEDKCLTRRCPTERATGAAGERLVYHREIERVPAAGEDRTPAAGEDRTPAAGEDKCLTRHHPRKRPTAVVEKRGESGGHVHGGKRRVSTAP